MPNALLNFRLLEFLRHSGRETRNARLVEIVPESAVSLK